VVAPTASADTLARLHAAGVRGIRLNLSGVSHHNPEWSGPPPPCGTPWPPWAGTWSCTPTAAALPAALAQLPADLPLVIDHMGKPDAMPTRTTPPCARSPSARQHTPVHVTLSGAYRLGGLDAGALARLWLGRTRARCAAVGQRLALHQP
jgi:hypothetical protein